MTTFAVAEDYKVAPGTTESWFGVVAFLRSGSNTITLQMVSTTGLEWNGETDRGFGATATVYVRQLDGTLVTSISTTSRTLVTRTGTATVGSDMFVQFSGATSSDGGSCVCTEIEVTQPSLSMDADGSSGGVLGGFLEDFWEYGDGNDFVPAFNRIQALGIPPLAAAGGHVIVKLSPGRTYRMASMVEIVCGVHIEGHPGENGNTGCLYWPNTAGIRTRFYQSNQADLTTGSLLTADGVWFLGAGVASGVRRHALHIDTLCHLKDCQVTDWGGDGIHIEADISYRTLQIYTQANNTAYSLRMSAGSSAAQIAAAQTITYTSDGSALASEIVNGITSAVNAVWSGAAVLPSAWYITIEDVRLSTTYTITVDGTPCTYLTPAAGTTAGATSAELVVTNLVTAINAAFPGACSQLNYDRIQFVDRSRTVGIDQYMSIQGPNFVTAGGLTFPALLSAVDTTLMDIAYVSAANNSQLYKPHVWRCGRYGLFFRGGDANQIDVYSPDVQDCYQGHVVDLSFVGNTFWGGHIAPVGNTDRAPREVTWANASSGGCRTRVICAYTEGSLPSWLHSPAVIFDGFMGLQPGMDATRFYTIVSGVYGTSRALAGASAGSNSVRGQMGHPTYNDVAGGMVAATPGGGIDPSVFWHYGLLNANWWELSSANSPNNTCEGTSTANNVRFGVARKWFHRGIIYGGGVDHGQTTPAKRLHAYTNGGIPCDMLFDPASNVSNATAATPIVLTVSTWAQTPIAGMRIRVEQVGGVTAANNFHQAFAPGATSVTLHDFAGGNVAGTGTYTASTGIAAICRLRGYAAAAPASGDWAIGDRIINNTPTVGQPIAWTCTVTGSPGTWVAEANL